MTPYVKRLLRLFCIGVSIAVLAVAGALRAQSTEKPASPAGEPVLRFTPEMARGLARIYARQVLMRRYEIDEQKAEQLTEPIARRLMATAHTIDQRGGELVEFVMEQGITAEAEGRQSAGMTPELAKGISQRLLPLMPEIRDLVRDIGNDLRPTLPFKQQLKLTADMALAGTALGALEQTMQRWEKGEVNPYENPFEPNNQTPQKEADGTSKQFKNAQKSAQNNIEFSKWRTWEEYVKQAKKLYDLDASQASTADSLLREFTERAKTVTQDTQWQERMGRNRLWGAMLIGMRMSQSNPLSSRLDRQVDELTAAVDQLDLELKRRIDEIPTVAQRQAGDRKILAALAEQGVTTTREAAP